MWRKLRATWGRPKRHGISGNFSTVVILTGIVVGAYILTGGGYPEIYPQYTSTPIRGEPIADQPNHTGESAVTLRELRMRKLPPNNYVPPNPPPGAPPDDGGGDDPDLDVGCDNKAFVFLVDVSDSMNGLGPNGESKFENVLNALYTFPDRILPTTIVGLFTFSSPAAGEPRARVIINPWADNATLYDAALSGINTPTQAAATHMRDGFEAIQGPLTSEVAKYPGYEFHLIFISDGVPENEIASGGCQNQYTPGGCGTGRNYDIRHDPTYTGLGEPDIASAIKTLPVTIHSIAIFNPQDGRVFPDHEELMKKISSGTEYYYDSAGAEDMQDYFDVITNDVCGAGEE